MWITAELANGYLEVCMCLEFSILKLKGQKKWEALVAFHCRSWETFIPAVPRPLGDGNS